MAGRRACGWCFTINNPGEGDAEALEYCFEESQARYLIFQKEKGEKETIHYQGYFFFETIKSLKQCKEISSTAHWEIAKGTPYQNKQYCSKKDTWLEGPYEFGELPEKGKRTDLLAVKEALDRGDSMDQISEDHFAAYCRYARGFKEYRLLHHPHRNWEMYIEVIWGPSGVGKSRSCQDEYPEAYWKSKNSGLQQFWDGYNGEETIIIDEFYGWLSWDYLLRLLDRYPLNLDIKHGTVPISAKKIIITSNTHPKDWYDLVRLRKPEWDTFQKDGTPFNPLQRRIHKITGISTGVEGEPSAKVQRITSEFDWVNKL